MMCWCHLVARNGNNSHLDRESEGSEKWKPRKAERNQEMEEMTLRPEGSARGVTLQRTMVRAMLL